MTDAVLGTAIKIRDAFQGKKAFIAYLMAGDPHIGQTREYILAMAEAGADLIEIGIPFSDPIAEGETIQQANLRAFASGTDIHAIFDMIHSLKNEIRIPLVLMTYINPVLNYGYDLFFQKCARCGVCGIILPDLPFEEQGEVKAHTARHGVELVTLIAPTSRERTARIARNAEGFIYLVSSLGVTGVRSQITTDISRIAEEIRRHTDIPTAVGFGIHTPEQAREISRQADGVIVGSAIVSIIGEYPGDTARLADYVRSMASAVHCR
jgi:tryptophan synthase alpha chain